MQSAAESCPVHVLPCTGGNRGLNRGVGGIFHPPPHLQGGDLGAARPLQQLPGVPVGWVLAAGLHAAVRSGASGAGADLEHRERVWCLQAVLCPGPLPSLVFGDFRPGCFCEVFNKPLFGSCV